MQNGNPLFWDDDVAAAVTGGPIAPPTIVSVWFRPHHWAPGHEGERLPLQVHFDLKERFGLPEAVMSDNTIEFHEPVRPGDVISYAQVLRSVSDEKTTKLGTGRFWVIDVEYTNQHGELVGVESYTGFGYRRAGVMPSLTVDGARRVGELPAAVATTSPPPPSCSARWPPGTGAPCTTTRTSPSTATAPRTSSSNTPNQAAWFERYLTDWTGSARPARPDDLPDEGARSSPATPWCSPGRWHRSRPTSTGCGWAELDVTLSVDGRRQDHLRRPDRPARPPPTTTPGPAAGDRWRP